VTDPYWRAIVARPPERAFDWVRARVGAGSRITYVRRLTGGTSSAIHAVHVVARGRVHRLVLRRHVRADWLGREPNLAEREARVLELLAATDVPAPELVAVDLDGSVCDVPAVLMARLPGRVLLDANELLAGFPQLAATLARIHAVDARSRVQPYELYYDPARIEPPPWSAYRDAWAKAIDLACGPAPAVAPCFIHRDFHPSNVLWRRGRLTGVVDWLSASWGPPLVDVAHCRLNLVALHGVEAAGAFLDAYRAVAGPVEYHPYWDVTATIDSGRRLDPKPFEGWGAHAPTEAQVRRRIDAHIVQAVARL